MSEWYESKQAFGDYYARMLIDFGALDAAIASASYIYPPEPSCLWVGAEKIEVSASVKKAIMAMPEDQLRRLNIRDHEEGESSAG